jgi:hypothetical protein
LIKGNHPAQPNTSTAPTLVPQRRTARASKKRYQIVVDDSEIDVSTESEEEWVDPEAKQVQEESAESEEEDEVYAESEKKDKKKPKGQKYAGRWAVVPETDDETGDEDELRTPRRETRRLLWDQMAIVNKVEKSAWDLPDRFVPDEEDTRLLSIMVVKPLLEQSTKWRSFHNDAPDSVKAMVMNGEIPTGKTKMAWANLAATPALYMSGLRVLLGKIQEELQEKPDRISDKLVNGRLHVWAFLAFNTEQHVTYPETIIQLIKKIDSPSIQKFAFAGYKTLLNSTITYLSSLEAKELFSIRTVRLENMTEEEYQSKVKENMKQSRRDRVEEQTWIQQIVNNMEKGKPWGQFRGDISWWAKAKAAYMEKFSGRQTPDASYITRYLNHKISQDYFKKLVEMSANDTVPTGAEMVNISWGLLKRYHLKLPHRVEIWGKFLLEHWLALINGGDASFPYVLADPKTNHGLNLEDPQVRTNTFTQDKTTLYVRSDPYSPDPADPNDPMADGKRDLLVGKAIKLDMGHKTSKYPVYIWLSKWDVLYGRCYENLRNLFLISVGKDPEDLSLPFFVNSRGEQLVWRHGATMDLTDFSIINQCGRVTSHVARKMMSDYIATQKDCLMTEGRQYFMCNSDQV